MRIDVVTLFPAMVEHAATFGVTGRARERGLWQLGTWNPRDFATDNHRTVDDRPYGGGPGMVMLAEPLAQALRRARAAQAEAGVATSRTIYLSPAGKPLTHARVVELAGAEDAGYRAARRAVRRHRRAAGRPRGRRGDRDRRFRRVRRRVAGADADRCDRAPVAGRAERRGSPRSEESFVDGLLDCPHYTRPEVYAGSRCPTCCCPGNHALIRRWRLKASLRRTMERRPDLLAAGRCRRKNRSSWRKSSTSGSLRRKVRRRNVRMTAPESTNRAHQGAPCAARKQEGLDPSLKRKGPTP